MPVIAAGMAVAPPVARIGRTMEPSGISCPAVASSVSARGVVSTPRVVGAAADMTARGRMPAPAEVATAATRVTAAAAVLRQRRRRAQDQRS